MTAEPLDWARVPVRGFDDLKVRKRVRHWAGLNAKQDRTVTSRREGDEYIFEAWEGELQTRAIDSFIDHPGLTAQLLAVQGISDRPWRAAGIRDALGVPAIFRAVALISTTTGALSLNAYRNGLVMEPEDRPKIIVRPDPFRKPRDFFRDTAWNMATMGEAWWWVARRDPRDDAASSLLNVNPAEVTVEENPADLRYPIIKWRGVEMRNDDDRQDMRHITFVQEPGSFRGVGPLQLCGAAISVAVESQEWAANYFAEGGLPSIVIKSAIDLSGGDEDDEGYSEAQRLRNAWIAGAHNTPKVIDPGIESVTELGGNSAGAQMLEARDYQNGEAGRMFGIPGSLLDYSTPGSSLTYQNLEGEFTKWVRAGLWPYFLEPIEQEMSDLLTRSTTARFNIDALERADIKTRFEVYKLGHEAEMLPPEIAQKMEGIVGGNVENAPVPFSPPAAIPSSLPIQSRSEPVEFRCTGTHVKRQGGVPRLATCGRLLSKSGAFTGMCPRCKTAYPQAA